MIAAIDRPVLRYHGSKWLAAPWIISHFPDHSTYVELFGGGGNVLIRKPAARLEVYNDADGQIVNFFRMLRERPHDLVEALMLTPYARAELELTYEDSDDPLEAARRTYVRMWQGHGGSRATWRTGWRFQKNINQRHDIVDDWRNHERLYATAERLMRVQIERGDALDVIRRFDTVDTLFYADPPYLAESRSTRWRKNAYGLHEMTTADHRALAKALNGIKGMAVVSGYASTLYDKVYAKWAVSTKRVQVDGRAHRTEGREQQTREEKLWISPAAAARAKQRSLWG